jgi:uroporphyrinogen III methyltransferase/synthase
VHNLASSLGEEQAADLLRSTVVACIGPVTAAAAQEMQIEPSVVARDFSVAGLVQAVVDHYVRSEQPAR